MRHPSDNPTGLKFFGFNKLLPYLKNYKKPVLGMVLGCLVGSAVDIGVPLFQSELWLVVCQYSWFPLAALAAAFPLWKGLRQEVLDRLNGVYTLWLAAVLVLSVLMIVGQSYNPFIYFRF